MKIRLGLLAAHIFLRPEMPLLTARLCPSVPCGARELSYPSIRGTGGSPNWVSQVVAWYKRARTAQ